ncbi:uncharacterized protein LOC119740032 [Patiria miniata]|uniref:Integrase zinc-binding domain-containing protein n=1 Tax=Patiria miniata TaxID=46514 RepID=A0A914B504_PATMI|nr:uncharacterized protein LOC119722910 [Patiria miniata]XP_038071153.1 uncharacterized protein LOC119740032 [Patiria miniata]
MTEVLTILQLCGFDPLPTSSNHVDQVPLAEPQLSILQLLQHQTHMQQVIVQQFQQINTLKSVLSQVICEQQQQRHYIQSLQCALHQSWPVPEVPIPQPVPDVPVFPVSINEPEPKIPKEAPRVPHRRQPVVPTVAPTSGQSSQGIGGIRCSHSHRLRQGQQQDPAIRKVVELKLSNPMRISQSTKARQPKSVQRLLNVWDRLDVGGGLLLYRRGEGKGNSVLVPVLPRSLRDRVLCSLHNSMETGGYGHVLKQVRGRYFWPSQHNDTMQYMRQHLKKVKQHEMTTKAPPSHESQDVPSPAAFRVISFSAVWVSPFFSSLGFIILT